MHVYGKFTDMFTYDIKATSILRNLQLLLVLMAFGATSAWADDYSGVYYILNNENKENNNPVYYLCPAINNGQNLNNCFLFSLNERLV